MRIRTQRFTPLTIFYTCLVTGLGLFALLMIPHAQATPGSGERLITIHDRGREQGIITRADTLRQVFKDTHITLDKNDIVEPALDEKLVTNNYQVNIYRARPVVIVDGATRQLVMSAYRTPKQIAEHAGVLLHDEDRATLEMTSNLLRDGASEEMVIDRAMPVVLTLYGKQSVVYTQALTVGQFLREKSITLGAKDTLSAPASTPITPNMKLDIWRNGKQTVTNEEPVDFEIEQIQDANREIGYREVKTSGVKGKKMVTYEIVMKNGHEVSRKAIQTVVTKQPSKQVEIVGAKPGFGGDFAAALAKLRACESGGNYANKNNPTYRGAYQFSYSTWGNRYGIYDPANASPAQQDQAARETYVRRGWQPWPVCGADLPDTYR